MKLRYGYSARLDDDLATLAAQSAEFTKSFGNSGFTENSMKTCRFPLEIKQQRRRRLESTFLISLVNEYGKNIRN